MEREAQSFHLLVCSHLYQQDLDFSELWIRRNSQQTATCALGRKRSRGTSPIIWKENGGESSMTQSTAAQCCVFGMQEERQWEIEEK